MRARAVALTVAIVLAPLGALGPVLSYVRSVPAGRAATLDDELNQQ
jgi:hypothetical protein